MGGLLGITGPPVKAGPGLGDTVPALFAAIGALAALREREVIAIVSEWTSARDKAEITWILGGVVSAGPVNTAADLFADPQETCAC
jgi:crotonobetainyl-CoA:carnitine CoA-transferase CaiB-like acyl-CoA transferase